MATYTIVDGFSGYAVAEVEAPSTLEAAIAGHRRQLADDKRPVDGWTYEAHGPRWGLPAPRQDGSGNGAQSLDDCLIVLEGAISQGALFDREHDDQVKAIVRCVPERESTDRW